MRVLQLSGWNTVLLITRNIENINPSEKKEKKKEKKRTQISIIILTNNGSYIKWIIIVGVGKINIIIIINNIYPEFSHSQGIKRRNRKNEENIG